MSDLQPLIKDSGRQHQSAAMLRTTQMIQIHLHTKDLCT